VLQINFEIAIL